MLIEIKCDQFRDGPIQFTSGLNVVLGDNNATNSIGKSTLLMVIDFVFGGRTFIKYNKDVSDELGDHQYEYSFLFEKKYYFKRNTASPSLIHVCDSDYNTHSELYIDDYTNFLKKKYEIPELTTFRSFIGLFSRVWGKENYSVNKPVHSFPAEKPLDCVNKLIRYFNRYESIKQLSEDIHVKKQEKKSLNKAFADKIIPKITKTKYKQNEKEIDVLSKEVKEIKENINKAYLNIREIIDKDIIKLKQSKDELLERRAGLENKLSRVNLNLKKSSYVYKKNFESLVDFFPQVNTDKLESIEQFHSKISMLLHGDLKQSQKVIFTKIKTVSDEINGINLQIEKRLSNIENPTFVVDKVMELSRTLANYRSENELYEKSTNLAQNVKELSEDLETEKNIILNHIEHTINNEIYQVSKNVFNESFKSPKISLSTNNYSYEVFEDTGTGKAFSSLIVFDLAMLKVSYLPLAIHDSMLFKNIENQVVSKLVMEYEKLNKQTFIAIDEHNKYDTAAFNILEKNKVIHLSDKKVLYKKDWRVKR